MKNTEPITISRAAYRRSGAFVQREPKDGYRIFMLGNKSLVIEMSWIDDFSTSDSDWVYAVTLRGNALRDLIRELTNAADSIAALPDSRALIAPLLKIATAIAEKEECK